MSFSYGYLSQKENVIAFRIKQEYIILKGTWQRGGCCGVFAEIGAAYVPYTTFRAVPVWASYS